MALWLWKFSCPLHLHTEGVFQKAVWCLSHCHEQIFQKRASLAARNLWSSERFSLCIIVFVLRAFSFHCSYTFNRNRDGIRTFPTLSVYPDKCRYVHGVSVGGVCRFSDTTETQRSRVVWNIRMACDIVQCRFVDIKTYTHTTDERASREQIIPKKHCLPDCIVSNVMGIYTYISNVRSRFLSQCHHGGPHRQHSAVCEIFRGIR